MKKLIIFLLLTLPSITFSHRIEIERLYRAYYSGENLHKAINTVENIRSLSNIEKKTIYNIICLLKIRQLENIKTKYEILAELIKENTPLLDENNETYLISVAEIVGFIIGYSPLNEMVYYSSIMKELYEKVISINPNSFDGLLGYSLWFFHAPGIIGGSSDRALEYLDKAYLNAKLDYQKYLTYVWYSQYYFKKKNTQSYNKYVELAKYIYPNGKFINDAVKQNIEKKKPM